MTDRFHVQKLAYEAVQEMRVKARWEALDKKARLQELARLLGGSEVTRNTLANAKELLAA